MGTLHYIDEEVYDQQHTEWFDDEIEFGVGRKYAAPRYSPVGLKPAANDNQKAEQDAAGAGN